MKKIFFYITSIFIIISLQGCVGSKNETYIKYKNNKEVLVKENVLQTKQIISEDISGIIKGRVSTLSYNGSKNLWEYFVQGIDTSNGKLQTAKFSHKKDVAKKGDLVYVFIDKGKLKDFYLLEKANYKGSDKEYVQKTKVEKKTKVVMEKRTKNQYSIISVPSSEIISLD